MVKQGIVIGLEAALGLGAMAVTVVATKKISKLERQYKIYELEFGERQEKIKEENKKLDDKKEKVEKELEELKVKTNDLMDKKKFIYDHEQTILDGASKMRNAIYSKDEKMRGSLLDEGYSLIENTLNDIRREIDFKKKFPSEIKKYNWLNESRTYILERVKLSGMTEEEAMAELTLMDKEKELLRWMLQA